jgi:hypothetical protein
MFIWYHHSALTIVTCRMSRLHQSMAHWQRALGTRADGQFKNSSLPKSFSFIRTIGHFILMIALPTTRSPSQSCRS